MKNNKLIILIIFAIVFILSITSGCVFKNIYLVSTYQPEVSYEYSSISLSGFVRASLCKVENYMFVYDTISHKNWSDYAFRLNDTFAIRPNYFLGSLNFSNITPNRTYFVRAVAYCYDFIPLFNNYEEKFYEGEEKTFIVH